MSEIETTETTLTGPTTSIDSNILLAQAAVRQQLNVDKYLASDQNDSIDTTLNDTSAFSVRYDDAMIAAYQKSQYEQEMAQVNVKKQLEKQQQQNNDNWISINKQNFPIKYKPCKHVGNIDLANLNASSITYASDLDKSFEYQSVTDSTINLQEIRSKSHSIDRSKISNKLVEEYKQHKNNELPRWYTRQEIENHSYRHDCWVVIFRKIYDITQLINDSIREDNANQHENGLLIRPLLKAAGTDISHWFDEYTMNVKTYIDPISERRVSYLPQGRFLHVAPNNPMTNWSMNEIENKTKDEQNQPIQWWKDWKYVIGLKTEKDRKIKIFNTLTKESNILSVCKEETLNDIQNNRYAAINNNCSNYTWKYQFTPLDMTKTLDENNVIDEEQLLQESGSFQNDFPTIYIYFDDDFTA